MLSEQVHNWQSWMDQISECSVVSQCLELSPTYSYFAKKKRDFTEIEEQQDRAELNRALEGRRYTKSLPDFSQQCTHRTTFMRLFPFTSVNRRYYKTYLSK